MSRDGQGSPPRSSWKYAWGDNATPGSGRISSARSKAASTRLFESARSSRQAREAMQRSLQSDLGASGQQDRVPRPSAKSQQLAANRYDKVMSKTLHGRYKKEALALAKAKGEETSMLRDVYNYGDMLFQEAQMTRERREEWRREQLQERLAAEEAEATFKPEVHRPSHESWGGGEPSDEELLERFQRQATAHREKQSALADYIREEEKKDLTFRPSGQSAKSKRLTQGYGDVLEEMKAKDEERVLRLRILTDRAEAEQRANFTGQPRTNANQHAKSRVNMGRSTESMGGETPRGGRASHESVGASSADGAFGFSAAAPRTATSKSYKQTCDRLHSTFTASYQQSLLPPACGDPECTFQPKLDATADGLEGSVAGFEDSRASSARASSRVAPEEVSEALYRDAQSRALRRQLLEAQAEAEAAEQRNMPKMSRNSDRYALRRIERDVQEIYIALDKVSEEVRRRERACNAGLAHATAFSSLPSLHPPSLTTTPPPTSPPTPSGRPGLRRIRGGNGRVGLSEIRRCRRRLPGYRPVRRRLLLLRFLRCPPLRDRFRRAHPSLSRRCGCRRRRWRCHTRRSRCHPAHPSEGGGTARAARLGLASVLWRAAIRLRPCHCHCEQGRQPGPHHPHLQGLLRLPLSCSLLQSSAVYTRAASHAALTRYSREGGRRCPAAIRRVRSRRVA